MRISMQRVLAGGVLVILVGSMSSTPSAGRGEEDDVRGVMNALEDLDRSIQERFANTGRRFGFNRLVDLVYVPDPAVRVHQTHLFVPESESEAGVVRRFGAARTQLVMYLAGHGRPRWGSHGGLVDPRPPVQGPVFVHPVPRRSLSPDRSLPNGAPSSAPNTQLPRDPAISDVPAAGQLVARAAESLGTLWQWDSHAFELGEWTFVARPIRATAQTCLNCHNSRPAFGAGDPTISEGQTPFRLGDPIGAVLYASRRLPPAVADGERPARE